MFESSDRFYLLLLSSSILNSVIITCSIVIVSSVQCTYWWTGRLAVDSNSRRRRDPSTVGSLAVSHRNHRAVQPALCHSRRHVSTRCRVSWTSAAQCRWSSSSGRRWRIVQRCCPRQWQGPATWTSDRRVSTTQSHLHHKHKTTCHSSQLRRSVVNIANRAPEGRGAVGQRTRLRMRRMG